MVSGMHVQAPQIHDIARRAKAAGKVAVLGGPSVSGAPEMYPDFDYLHVGEIGEATDRLLARLDEDCAPPPAQVRFETIERLSLSEFPVPAYHLIRLDRYLLGSLQFSSGCPYRCEFCDIPALYGRQPRLKTPEQLAAELDAMLAQGSYPSFVYFVDDNFIGNRKATREMLPHLIAWQKRRGHPLRFGCEATLNLAKQPEILALMRAAEFHTVFVGIETPEVDALKHMRKEQNATLPMLEAIGTLNSYGLEVTSGIILGLDTDTADTEARLKAFIDASNVPILTITCFRRCRRRRCGIASSAMAGSSPTTAILKAMCGSCVRTARWWRCGGVASPTPTPRNDCSNASPGRSRGLTPTGSSGRCAASSLGTISAWRSCWRATLRGASEFFRTIAAGSGRRCYLRSVAARSTPRSAWASSGII